MGILLAELEKGGPALTAAAAVKLVKAAGESTSSAAVTAAFELLASQGRVHRHPGATTRSAPAYSLQSGTALVVQGVSNVLKAGTQHSLTSLRASAPKAYAGQVDEEIGRLVREGKLFRLPGKTPKYTTQRPRPTSALTATQRKSLETVLGKLNPLRARSLGLDELLEFLDGAAAPPLQVPTSSSTAASVLPVQPAAKPTRAPTLPWLLELYRADLPARGGLTAMPIPWTWRRYAAVAEAQGGAPDKAAFERVLLDGSSRGLLEITPHERPSALSPDDAAAAIRQPDGGVLYYWRPVKEQG